LAGNSPAANPQRSSFISPRFHCLLKSNKHPDTQQMQHISMSSYGYGTTLRPMEGMFDSLYLKNLVMSGSQTPNSPTQDRVPLSVYPDDGRAFLRRVEGFVEARHAIRPNNSRLK
jgi:hypothetical protein